MSVLHNKKNIELQKQRNKLQRQWQKTDNDLAAQQKANRDADEQRILIAAGVNNPKSKMIYDLAVVLADIIINHADKHYGAMYYLLMKLLEQADKYSLKSAKASNMYDILDDIFSNDIIEKMTVDDPAYKKLEKQYQGLQEGNVQTGRKIEQLYKRIKELEHKYPEAGVYFGEVDKHLDYIVPDDVLHRISNKRRILR